MVLTQDLKLLGSDGIGLGMPGKLPPSHVWHIRIIQHLELKKWRLCGPPLSPSMGLSLSPTWHSWVSWVRQESMQDISPLIAEP